MTKVEAGSGARVKGADLDSDSRTKGSSREFKGSADHNRAFRATRQGTAREDARNFPSKEADGKEKEAQKKPYQPRFKIVAGRIVPVDIVNEEGTPEPQPSSSRMDGSTSAAPHPKKCGPKLDSQPARQHRNGRAPPKNGKNVPARDKKVEETQCRNKYVQDRLKRTEESKSPSHMQARIMRSQTSKSVQECNQPASQHRDGKLPLKNKNNVTFKDSKVEDIRSQNKDLQERVKRIKERKPPSNTKARIMRSQTSKSVQECNQPASQHRDGKLPLKNKNNVTFKDSKVEDIRSQNKDLQERVKRIKERKPPSNTKARIMRSQTSKSVQECNQPASQHRDGKLPLKNKNNVTFKDSKVEDIRSQNKDLQERVKRIKERKPPSNTKARIMRSQTSKSVQECNQPASQHRDGKLPLKNKNNVTFKDSKVEDIRSQNKDLQERVKRIKERKPPSNTKKVSGCGQLAPDIREVTKPKASVANRPLILRTTDAKKIEERNKETAQRLKQIEERKKLTGNFLNKETTLKTTSSRMDSSTSVAPQPVKSGTKLLHRPVAQRRNEELGPENNQNFTFEGSKGDKIRRRKKELPEGLKLIEEGSLPSYKQTHDGATKAGGTDLKEEVSNVPEPEVLARSCGGGSTAHVEYSSVNAETVSGSGQQASDRPSISHAAEVKKIKERNKVTAEMLKQIYERKMMAGDIQNENHGGTRKREDVPSEEEVSHDEESETVAGSCGGGSIVEKSISSVNVEGRTSSKRSNARVDGPNLRSPPVSEDWEEKEVPYSDGDNRRHCTLDQINVKDNDVDEEFRTLPETQHHSTLENPAEIIRQQASVAEQIDCQESASGTKDASRGIGTKPIAPTADSGDTPSRTGEQDLFGENQSMGKEELEDGPKEACGSPEDEDTAIEQESSEKCGPGGECPQASDEGRTLDQINVKDNDVDEEFRTLPETQHHSTLEDTAIEQESSEKCGPGGECPQASDEGRTLDQINVKDNDVDEEFRTLPETQHHSTLEDTAIEQESSEKCGPGGECPQASDEGRTSSKRSNARVDGPNLRSPPVSEDWEEKEVPYSDGDNRRHCTLDQINVKDNDVDEEFRTLPETQHHSTLENPAEIIRQQASVAEQIDCQESASGTKDASRGIGTKPIAPTADSGDTPSRTGEQDLFGENQSMGKEELEDGPKEACGSPEDEDTAIEQESSEKCGPGGECPQASDEETSSEPGCEKTNTRRVGKKILNGGKRKNGTKQIPEETEKIPEHAARKKRDPKLEALRLMMEERQKEAFEKTKERTRPGINPKYHYLNQKKPAQNVIEGAVPAPLRPAAKRRLAKPVSKKKRDPKVEAMRLAEKERQEEAFEEAKLRRRPGINPKYHYLNRKRPGRGDELAQTEGRGAAAGGKPVEEPGAGSWAMSFKQRKMGPRQNTNNHQGVPVADRQWIPRSTDSLSEVEDTVDHHPSSRVMKPKTVCKKPKKIAARNIEEELKGGRNKTAKLPNKGVPVADRQWIPRSTDSLSDVEDTVDHHPSSRVMKPKTVCKKPKKIVAKNIKEELKAGRNKTAKFPNENTRSEVTKAKKMGIPREIAEQYHDLVGKPTSRRMY